MKFKVKGHIVIPYEYEIEAEGSINAYKIAKRATFDPVYEGVIGLNEENEIDILSLEISSSKIEVHNITPILDGEAT